MDKEKYTRAEMQITEFEIEDVITTSSTEPEENELPILK